MQSKWIAKMQTITTYQNTKSIQTEEKWEENKFIYYVKVITCSLHMDMHNEHKIVLSDLVTWANNTLKWDDEIEMETFGDTLNAWCFHMYSSTHNDT